MVFHHWPGLILPDSQYPSLKRRCFDTWATNRVEQENGNLKEGQTGLESTSSRPQVMAVTPHRHRDRKRKDKTLKKSYREEASTPVTPEPILRNLYHLLPTRILVLLEQECARSEQFQVYSLHREATCSKPTLVLRTTEAARYGLAPRRRTIRLRSRDDVMDDSPSSKILTCDCGHFDR